MSDVPTGDKCLLKGGDFSLRDRTGERKRIDEEGKRKEYYIISYHIDGIFVFLGAYFVKKR